MTIILLVVFIILLLLDVPVAFCMLLSSLLALLCAGVNPVMVGLETARSLTSFYAFLAVPFFILAGELMNHGGLSQRLVAFIKSLIGHHKNGLPAVTTISSQLFGAVSGASAATCAAIGSVMIPAMDRNKYPRAFSAAVTACSGTTGAIIPPSIVLIIYGTIANVSIEKLFVAGIVPGILIGAGIIAVSWRLSGKMDITVEKKAPVSEIRQSSFNAIFTVLLAVIIFAGILGGIFTATEASAVAVVYAFVAGFFIYRQLKLKDIPRILISAAKTTSSLSFLIACASLFAWTLSIGKVPEILTGNLLRIVDFTVASLGPDIDVQTGFVIRKILILIVLNISLLLVGMFIDAGPGLLIVVPVVLPLSTAIGMDSGLSAVHFGVIVVSNLIIGLVTPPVGSTLFVASAVGRVGIVKMTPYVLKFLVVMILVQFLITFVPLITTWLPSLM